jgi:nicotinate-nucleotide pyrophosphorylase (carboxylating)
MTTDTDEKLISTIIRDALQEDLGQQGDITSRAIFAPGDGARAIIKSKADGVLCGTFLLAQLFGRIDPALQLDIAARDGDRLTNGTVICTLQGPILAILAGERLALNLLQRLSGIATQTNRLVQACEGTSATILDTRKTTPLLRVLEKRAVRAGGGANHRFGLFDMILIKDTHVKAAGGVAPAIRKAQAFRGGRQDLKIEAEVQSYEEFLQAVPCRPDRIMLDNMSCAEMARCVQHLRESKVSIELEASGNVSEQTVRSIAQTGVDFISVGSVTHSVKAIDIHLVIV